MSTDRPVVHVLVPAYRGGSLLFECLESVLASGGVTPRILVVDDASSDGSPEALRAHFPEIEVVVQERNRGFAANCNRGFELLLERGAERVFLLNQDTRLAPDALARLVGFLEEHPRVGAVGPKTYSFQRDAGGGERLLYAGAWRRRLPLRQTIPGIEQVEREPRTEPVRVDYVWGHGVLLRGTALREVGGFDTGFPMYYEDLDLCRRLEDAGHELWCLPGAVMWHDLADGARGTNSEYWRWAHKVRSVSVFHRKHYGRLAAALLTPLTIGSEVWELLRGRRGRASVHLAVAGLRHGLGLAGPAREVTP
jgi:GT2 family glycosyltransferase